MACEDDDRAAVKKKLNGGDGFRDPAVIGDFPVFQRNVEIAAYENSLVLNVNIANGLFAQCHGFRRGAAKGYRYGQVWRVGGRFDFCASHRLVGKICVQGFAVEGVGRSWSENPIDKAAEGETYCGDEADEQERAEPEIEVGVFQMIKKDEGKERSGKGQSAHHKGTLNVFGSYEEHEKPGQDRGPHIHAGHDEIGPEVSLYHGNSRASCGFPMFTRTT